MTGSNQPFAAPTAANERLAPRGLGAPGALTCTVADATRITGLSRATLYRAANAGRLRLTKVGRRTLICMASLRELVGAEP